MGKLQLFEIYLNDSRVIYSSGEQLSGTGKLRPGAVLAYRAIRVTCIGSCGVSNKAYDTSWTVEETYFSTTLPLADKGTLSPGEYAFPFQFLLPTTAPTSFEGQFGNIVHQLWAVIDTPCFSKDHKCSRIFYILSPLNLNSLPDIEQTSEATTTKKFSYKLVKSGSVILTASTDLRGYVVGQVVQLRADIENHCGKETGSMVASLLHKVSYKANRWICDLRTIAEVEGSGVKAWKQAQWPPLCLSTFATVPYFDEGLVVSMPTASDLILPREYSTWGYPYAEAPPSYEQSCNSASSGLSNGN